MSIPPLPPSYRYVNDKARDEGVEFACTRCNEHHRFTEMGYGLPDAVFRLEGGRESDEHVGNEDIARIGTESFFIRGVAKFNVAGVVGGWGIGFWLQVSADDWAAFVDAQGRLEKPILGNIANQAACWGPTLGTGAQAVDAGPGMRPTLEFLNVAEGNLAKLQRSGISPASMREQLSGDLHEGQKAPARPFWWAELERDGWQLLKSEGFKETGFQAPEKLVPGDYVKVPVSFSAAARTGEPETLIALWWVEVDEADDVGAWSGTLANDPPFPSTLAFGARICGGRANIVRAATAAEALQDAAG